MENQLVSIITPVYNSEKFLEDTIKSIENQTYTNWEWILIDDCSTDKSVEVIKKYANKNPKIRLIKLKENSGAAIARNTGIDNAKGKYIAFLDSDDLWKKEKLEKQIKFMQKNNYEFTYTGYEFADEKGKPTGKVVKVPTEINYKQALKNTTISTCAVIFDIENLDKQLIYMPNIRKGQDTATWWKILKTGITAYGINESLFLYRRSENTLSSNKFAALKRTWNLYRNVEKLSFIASAYNFIFYVFNAIKRRV